MTAAPVVTITRAIATTGPVAPRVTPIPSAGCKDAARAHGCVRNRLARDAQKWRDRDKLILGAMGKPPSTLSMAIIIADRATRYDVLLDVLFTLGQTEFGQFHFMVLMGADAGSPRPAQLPKPVPVLPASVAPPGMLGLRVRIDGKGISITTSAGGIAIGCAGLGAGLTLPKVGAAHDRAGLAACAQAISRDSGLGSRP